MDQMLSGAIATASLVAALFFLRFWRQTHDRFFLYFALSFLIEAGNRVALGVLWTVDEDGAVFYSVRVVAYGLILLAIWQKNRPPQR
jgi:hypothetical protein